METFFNSILILAVIGVCLYAIYYFFNRLSQKFEEKTAAQFRLLAAELGWNVQVSDTKFSFSKWKSLILNGHFDDIECKVCTEEWSSGEDTNYKTVITFYLPKTYNGIFFEFGHTFRLTKFIGSGSKINTFSDNFCGAG